MSVSIVIPYAYSTPHRERLFNFTRSYAESLGYEVIIGTSENMGAPVSFNHPKAINSAVAKSTASTIMIMDGDTLPSGDWRSAISYVDDGEWSWSMPKTYLKVNEESTEEILSGRKSVEEIGPDESEWHGTTSWAGIQICRRESFLEIGGWDERFTHWGSDDACFGLAMDAVTGEHTRFEGYAVHLWHPQSPSDSHLHENWGTQFALTQQYGKRANDRDRMLAFIERGR